MIREFDLIGNMNSYIVYGLGKSGLAAIELLQKTGVSNEFILPFEDKYSEEKLNEFLLSAQPGTLVLSPGIPIRSPRVQKILSKGWALSSEIDLACRTLTTEKIIGITGSVGKSTVTSLLGEGVKVVDPNAFVGGNLGIPFSQYAIDLLDERRPKATWVILELSSYQLENCKSLQLDHSVLTYFAANHLERYDSLEAYYDTKLSIGKRTKEHIFVNTESADLRQRLSRLGTSVIRSDSSNVETYRKARSMKLWGAHNLENVALALTVAKTLKWGAASEQSILNFPGLSHRLEFVGRVHEIDFLNDSKATAIDSVLVATHACFDRLLSGGTLHLLIGGRDKNLPWGDLSKIKSGSGGKNFKIYFFGECRTIAKNKSQLDGKLFEKLTKLMPDLFLQLKPNDIVLLSPGGTSLDEFKNFEDRGNFFSSAVKEFAQRPMA